MGIEQMQHIAVLVPASDREPLTDWLYGRRQVHLEPFAEMPEKWAERFRAVQEDASQAEEHYTRLQAAAAFLSEYRTDKGGFLESLFPVRVLASHQDIREAVREVDVDWLGAECQSLAGELASLEEDRANYLAQRDRVSELSFLEVKPKRLEDLSRVAVRFVTASGEAAKAFLDDERMKGDAAAEVVGEPEGAVTYCLVAPASKSDVLKAVISDYGLRDIWLPAIDRTVTEEIARLEEAAEAAGKKLDELGKRAVRLAADWARKVDLAMAYWDGERIRIRQQGFTESSKNLFVARGYVRTRELDELRSAIEERFPGSSLVVTPPPVPEEEPPVAVRWNRFLRPAGLLVRMFGLPSYRGIDPTAYLTITFLAFFGICFGDLVYGTMLIALSMYLMRRYRGQKGLVIFFKLFTYAGVATALVGVLTGSWAANFTIYLGEDHPVNLLRLRLALLDPLAKPMMALGIAIGIGVVNQFYGIFMLFLRNARRGDWAAGVFDGLFWIGYLAGLMAVALSGMGMFPGLFKPALAVFAVSALGLVLTQGRDQKSWPVRIIAGVVSLYGITGSYGTTSFVGDVVSYSRLLALALTTFVVGMTFNIIASLLIPLGGWPLFVIVAGFGHVFNFTISILGAFVHSARLILLEWFGRFYEGGGREFRPFGFRPDNVELVGE